MPASSPEHSHPSLPADAESAAPPPPSLQGTTIRASFKAVEADKDFRASGSVGVKAALKLTTTIEALGDLVKGAKVVPREVVNITGMDVDIPGMPPKPPGLPGATAVQSAWRRVLLRSTVRGAGVRVLLAGTWACHHCRIPS
jgi:hypothetical protein